MRSVNLLVPFIFWRLSGVGGAADMLSASPACARVLGIMSLIALAIGHGLSTFANTSKSNRDQDMNGTRTLMLRISSGTRTFMGY